MARRAVARKPAKAEPAERDYTRIASEWEEGVESGAIPACSMVRAAIARQRRMLADPPRGYVFDAEAGDKACRRAEILPYHEGPKRGEKFRLSGFQVWMVRTLFGWVDPVNGWRLFREASIWLPKGQGKSPLAALIALIVLLVAKGGDKVYSAASTQKQARHVFDAAKEMLRLSPDVREHFGLETEEHRIKGASDNRNYEPVSSEAGSIEGIRPSVLLLDEVHVLGNRKLYDNLSSAAAKVDGSLFVTISTAGLDMSPQAIGYQLYTRAREVLEGKADEPALFVFIVEADRKRPDGTDSDPMDFNVWREANPNLGVSVSVAGLEKAQRTWRDVPSERASIEVKHLGWWQQTTDPFLDRRLWDPLADQTLDIEKLDPAEGWELYVGIDLARTRDLTTAPVVAARTRDDGKREYRIYTRWTYLPAASATILETPDIKVWADEGWIELINDANGEPAQTMSFRPLVASVGGLVDKWPQVQACVDEWMAAEVENELAERGVTVVAIRQGAKTQSEPMKELESACLDKRLLHDGSPVAAWCIGNLKGSKDRNGNVAPTRDNDSKKIDVAVGIINALVRARGGESDVHVGDLLL